MSKPGCTLGVDIGGTKVAVVVRDAQGAVLARRRAETSVHGQRDPGLAISLNLARQVLADAATSGMRVQGIGVGVPEYVSPAGELTSREVMDWDIQPSELFGTLGPVWIESDVRCGALAEARQGAGRELDSFMYVTVGTGLSSTLVVRGAPWMGHRGEAIALGELPVDSFLDVSRINLESFCSGAGMAIRYEALTGQAPEAHLANEAASGDTAAHEVLVSGARALGRALAATAKIVDPAAFVLGGGLGTSRGLWQGELYREYEAAVGPRPGAPPLIQATLGEDSGAIGAALLPLARSS